MTLKYLGYTVITIALLLLTFFGVGPVLFADGSTRERMITLLVVLLLYALLILLLAYWKKRYKVKR